MAPGQTMMATESSVADARRGDSTSLQSLLISGSSFDLSQWLRVSWFFPPNFGLESILETEHSLFAIGTDLVYKFPKHLAVARPLDAGERWKLSCEEIRDHEQLAPGFYQGLRCLNWIDDEPHWLTEDIEVDIDPYFPRPAHDIACITKRIPNRAFLDQILISHRSLPERLLQRLAKTLANFYHYQLEGSRIRYTNDADEYLGRRQHHLESIRAIVEGNEAYIPSPFHVAVQELVTLTGRFLAHHERLFNQRGEAGFIVGCHGDLIARHIWLREADDSSTPLGFFGRPPRSSQARRDDLLSDIASLVLDLETSGLSTAAQCFEQHYAEIAGDQYQEELLHFYVASAALRKTARLIGRASRKKLTTAEIESIETILGSAYRYILGLRRRVIVGLGGKPCSQKAALASSLTKLLHGVKESAIESALRELSLGKNVVVESEFEHRAERLGLISSAEQHQADYLLIRCESSENSRETGRSRAQCSVTWDRQIVGTDINYLQIEPVIAPEYQATSLLRDLSRIRRNNQL